MTERRLGRGLDSLVASTSDKTGQQVLELPLDSIEANPDQPRSVMNAATLDGLAQSIRSHGVLQPIVVQRLETGYRLVAGERRLRASRLAGRGTIPALIIEATGSRSLELALIENIQRENLGAIEEAAAYEALIEKTGLTHQLVADRLGKSRAAVTNTLRLLELPDRVKQLLAEGQMSAGLARALLGANTQSEREQLAELAIRRHWSVRQIEAHIRETRTQHAPKGRRAFVRKYSSYEDMLMRKYDANVSIRGTDDGGAIVFKWSNSEGLARLIDQLSAGSKAIGQAAPQTRVEPNLSSTPE
ncbi:MAG: ParB/RepB/Spo0J family partition protein [Planctomycetota bacterium]